MIALNSSLPQKKDFEIRLLLFGSFVSLLFVFFFSFNHLAAKAKSRHADQSIYFLGSHSLTTAKVT